MVHAGCADSEARDRRAAAGKRRMHYAPGGDRRKSRVAPARPRGPARRAAAGGRGGAGRGRAWAGHVLKAQVLEGGRGKRGLVRRLADFAALGEARRAIAAALGDAETPLLLEEAIPIAREIYLAVRIDGTRQALELLVAPQGGEDVEQHRRARSHRARSRSPRPRRTCSIPNSPRVFAPDLAARLARYAARLPEIARREDLELLEINPLALTAGRPADRLRRQDHPRRQRGLPPRSGGVSAEPRARRARHDAARTAGARPRLPPGRDRRRRRAGHLGRRARHDDDGPARRPRARRRLLHGQSARRAGRDHGRAAAHRARDRASARR